MKVVMKAELDICAMSCLPRGEAHRVMRLRCAASQGLAKGHSNRMWRTCSGVRIPRRYPQSSHIPLVGGGLVQRWPMWKASIWTLFIMSLRLGQRPSDMRGRMSLFRTWGMGVFGSIRRVAQEELLVVVGV